MNGIEEKEVAEIAKFTPVELKEYEDSLKTYRNLKNSLDTAEEKGETKGEAKEGHRDRYHWFATNNEPTYLSLWLLTGAIAGAYYHQMPASLYEFGINKLPEDIKDIINKFDQEHGHMVSYKWYNPEFPKEELVRKVRSGEIFIWGMKMSERGNNKWKEKDVTLWLPVYRIL